MQYLAMQRHTEYSKGPLKIYFNQITFSLTGFEVIKNKAPKIPHQAFLPPKMIIVKKKKITATVLQRNQYYQWSC